MTKAERKQALKAADRQIAQARLELLALKAQGVDLAPIREMLLPQGFDLNALLAADSRAKRQAVVDSVKAAMGLPCDPLAAQAAFCEAFLGVLGAELAAVAECERLASQPTPFAQN